MPNTCMQPVAVILRLPSYRSLVEKPSLLVFDFLQTPGFSLSYCKVSETHTLTPVPHTRARHPVSHTTVHHPMSLILHHTTPVPHTTPHHPSPAYHNTPPQSLIPQHTNPSPSYYSTPSPSLIPQYARKPHIQRVIHRVALYKRAN